MNPGLRLRRPHRVVALLAAACAAVAGVTGPAFADDQTSAASPGSSTTASAVSQPAPPADGPVQVARTTAKSTGKPVTVEELTTETSLTVANPDGTLTRTDHHQPARVKKNGSWTAVDATLAKNADGTWSPKAAASGVQLSGGGTGPLATFTDPKGRSFSFTLPFALPVPTVSGDSIQYAEVLPGVDLKATVTDQGAFREVLVVHDAEAAANPALKQLRLGTTAHGLATSADQGGNITAKAEDGTAVFVAPTPVMWDSTTTAPTVQAEAQNSLSAEDSGTSSKAVQSQAQIETAGSGPSSEEGPGDHARISAIKVTADATGLTLTPDQSQLTSPDTVYPVYIDPYVNPATSGTNHYLEVQEGCSGAGPFDVPQTNGEGVGYQHYSSQCYGLERSFYEFDTSNLNTRMVVSESRLYFTETHGSDNGCGNSWPVTLKFTGGISNGMGWPGPGVAAELGTQNVPSAGDKGACGYRSVNFEITNIIKSYLSAGNLTFGLYGNESKYATNYGFMRFASNPYIQTKFDIPPNAPTNVGTTPSSQNPSGPGCDGNPGWIGMTTLNGNASNITLNAQLSTDMSGVNLHGGYHVWDNMANDGGGHPTNVNWMFSNWVASGGTVYTNIGVPVSDGHQYGWNVWANDDTLDGPHSPDCHFNVDLSPPTLASFTPSTSFPALGGGSTPTGHAGDTATVTVSSTDPMPGGCTLYACVNSGVQAFQYSLDVNIPVSGANTVNATVTNGVATANIPITVPSNQWGTHTLYVRAIDRAGNTQATAATYSFYAPWNPTAKVTAGDLTGDGVPDMLATTTDGDLALIGGNSVPSATPVTASIAGQSPDRSGWNNYLIAHRGSVTQQAKDDLFAYQKSTHQMYVYKNDATATPPGTAGHFTIPQGVQGPLQRPACVTTPAGNCTGYNTADWSSVTQMTAPGTVSTAAYAAGNNTTVPQSPDLITIENGKLWYYIAGANTNTYFDTAYPIGTGDWSTVGLVGVGNVGATVTGTGSSATTTGGTPTLWVRNNTTGAISSFPLTFDSNGIPTSVIAAPTRAALVSGVKDTAGKNMCLDIANSNTADGTPAQVWNCNGTDAQSFTLGGDNTIHVLGRCLDADKDGTANGTPIQLWNCNNGGAQQWIPGPFAGSLLNPQSGRCLADPAASNTPGTQLILWDCVTGNADQNWAATTGSVLPAAQPILPLGLNSKIYPAVATPGDVDGDGNPELYALANDARINNRIGARPAAGQAVDHWKLTDTTDTVRANGLTLSDSARFQADATRGTVLNLPGTTSYAASTSTSVDTSKSYTVAAWVN